VEEGTGEEFEMKGKFFRRRRRFAVGLAFAALVVPTAAQAGVMTDGPARGVHSRTDARHAALLDRQAAPANVGIARTTDLGPLDGWAYGLVHRSTESTVTPLQADGMRLSGIATAYQSMATANGPLDGWAYGLVHRSTGPSVTGLQADGLRLQGIAKAYEGITPATGGSNVSKTTEPVSSTGFNWSDAGVGASVAFGVALLLVLSVAIGRRRHTRTDRTGLARA
jgi:hypothetical protein